MYEAMTQVKRGIIMKYKFISDNHTHSQHSFDGKDSVAMLAERALHLGLYSLTVTDHCDCQEYYKENVRKSIEDSVRDVMRAKGMYADRLRVYTGIELGQPTQDMKAAKEALSLGDYDFVLGSLHNLRGEQDFYFLEYDQESSLRLIERYFDELLELARCDCFDSLAHLTYPFRYINAHPEINADVMQFAPQLDAVLETIIKNGKALEVNTSGLRQAIGKTLPDENVVRRFRELGGKYVTIGSDAHRWSDIGAGIEDGLNMLLKCGFTHFTVYSKREPVMLPVI